jgi:hypothetical protein
VQRGGQLADTGRRADNADTGCAEAHFWPFRGAVLPARDLLLTDELDLEGGALGTVGIEDVFVAFSAGKGV